MLMFGLERVKGGVPRKRSPENRWPQRPPDGMVWAMFRLAAAITPAAAGAAAAALARPAGVRLDGARL